MPRPGSVSPGGLTACYSPLAWLDAVSWTLRKMRTGSLTRWDNQARRTGTRKAKVLIAGIILHTATHGPSALATVRDKLTFMYNAGVIQTFRVNDLATADMLLRTIGDTTIECMTFGTSGPASISSDATRSESSSGHVTPSRLVTPDELRRSPSAAAGSAPASARRQQDLLLFRAGVRWPLRSGVIAHTGKADNWFGVSTHPALSTNLALTDTYRRIDLASLGSLRPSGRSCDGCRHHETKAYCPLGNSGIPFSSVQAASRS